MVNLFLALVLFCSDGYLWKPIEDAPGNIALWKDGKQVGALEVSKMLYHKFEKGKFIEDKPPIEVPQEYLDQYFEETTKLTGNYGVDWAQISPDIELFSFSGQPLDRDEAHLLIGDSVLKDDSNKLHLTIIGPKAQRDKAKLKIKTNPDFLEFENEVHLQAFPPDSWAIKGRGFKVIGELTYYLQDAKGEVIYAGESEVELLQRLRIFKKPPPNPFSIDWRSWTFGFNPFTWMAGLSFSYFHMSWEPIILIVLLVLGFLLLRKKK